MDLAYDHIAEQTYSGDRASTPTPAKASASSADAPVPSETRQSLQTEFQETFKAFSNSPWGSKLGGLWGNVRKQSESYYEGARREAEAASGEALKGLTDLKESLVNRTRGLSIGEQHQKDKISTDNERTEAAAKESDASLRENDTFIARFRSEATKRLKDIEKAEDAADEALLRFGTNIRNFLKDAVSVAPPADQEIGKEGTVGSVLFESRDLSGKRVIHSSRADAQLHVIHTSLSSFAEDPMTSGDQWFKFKDNFNIDQKTDAISKDLEKYPDLRNAMERMVPEKVEYKDFWCRYYFLRHVVESQEERRKELLKASANETEEVAWGEDSDDENAPSTPQNKERKQQTISHNQNNSTTTIQQMPSLAVEAGLKQEGRRSHDEKSVADSDASYDLVSGATSRTPGSPKEDKLKTSPKAEESDEEDWE